MVGAGVLILNVGGSQLDVPYTAFTENPPIYVGDVSDSYSGSERNSIRAAKRSWTVTTGLLSPADETSIWAAIGNLAQIPCKGSGFNNSLANITCSVMVTSRRAAIGIAFSVWTLNVKAVTAV